MTPYEGRNGDRAIRSVDAAGHAVRAAKRSESALIARCSTVFRIERLSARSVSHTRRAGGGEFRRRLGRFGLPLRVLLRASESTWNSIGDRSPGVSTRLPTERLPGVLGPVTRRPSRRLSSARSRSDAGPNRPGRGSGRDANSDGKPSGTRRRSRRCVNEHLVLEPGRASATAR